MRYFIGDVRDLPRLQIAMEGVDVVVHAAALKQVPAAEYNPFEAVKTNILGAKNIDAVVKSSVKHVIALSTDKAAAPINLYGATKLCSDKLFVAANHWTGSHNIKFGVVRYGNVMGSRGSVIPLFLKHQKSGKLPITDSRMTRFNITLEQGVNFVLFCLKNMWGGELFVPKIPSYRITDLAAAVGPKITHEYVGMRPGEKLHEEMITQTDALNTIEFKDYYVILPARMPTWNINDYLKQSSNIPGKKVEEGFSYNSGKNPHFLSVNELKELINSNFINYN